MNGFCSLFGVTTYFVATMFTLVYGCIILVNRGKATNRVFETTTYAGFLVFIGVLICPFGLGFTYELSKKVFKNPYYSAACVIFLIFVNVVNQSIHVAHSAENIVPIDITQPPDNDFEERVMHFAISTFSRCCGVSNVTGFFCEDTNFTFPCILDEEDFFNQRPDSSTCTDVALLAIESCGSGFVSFSVRAVDRWKNFFGPTSFALFGLSFLLLCLVPLYLVAVKENIEHENQLWKNHKPKVEEEPSARHLQDLMSGGTETEDIPLARRATETDEVEVENYGIPYAEVN